MLRIFDSQVIPVKPDLRIAVTFQDDEVFAPFRVTQIRKNKRTINVVTNDIQAYFNAQRLALFGNGVQDQLLQRFKEAELLKQNQTPIDDNVIISSIKERWLQSTCDVRNFMRSAQFIYEDFCNDIIERQRELDEEKNKKEENQE